VRISSSPPTGPREVDSARGNRSKLFAIAIAVCLTVLVTLLADLASAAPNPPGNNGTIKIDATPFDDLPDNEPQVGCSFQVDFAASHQRAPTMGRSGRWSWRPRVTTGPPRTTATGVRESHSPPQQGQTSHMAAAT
jgi:hypothetical protein